MTAVIETGSLVVLVEKVASAYLLRSFCSRQSPCFRIGFVMSKPLADHQLVHLIRRALRFAKAVGRLFGLRQW